MRRVVSLYLPTWPTDRIRRRNGAPPPDEPLVTASTEGSRRLIGAVDQAAHALGLRPGQTIAHAQAMVPSLHIVDATPEEDEASLAALAHWCIGYSPIVAANPPDGIWIDIAGAAHLFGGEEKLVTDLVSRLRAQSIQAGCLRGRCTGRGLGASRGMEARSSCRRGAPSRRLKPAGSGSAPAAGDGRGASSSRDRADRPACRDAARADGPPLRQGGRCSGSIRPSAMSSSRSTRSMPKETPARRVTFAEPIGRLEDLQSVVQTPCGQALPRS